MKQSLTAALCVLLSITLTACLKEANTWTQEPTDVLAKGEPVVFTQAVPQATIYFDDSTFFSFQDENATALADLLAGLSYDPELLCDCLPEYQVKLDSGVSYGIHLSSAYARCETGQALLTDEQVAKLQSIVQWAKESNAPHSHSAAEEAQTVSDPISGYCGNTQTTIYFDGSASYSFMYENSVTVTDILANLDYDPDKVCRCLPEYTVDTEFGSGYGINLTESYARCEKGQADLTQEQVQQLQSIILWAKEQAG